MPCLKSVKEVCLHQCVLLLQRHAELSVLAQQGVELQQVSCQRLCILLQIRRLTVLYFDLTWWDGVGLAVACVRVHREGYRDVRLMLLNS